MGDGGFVGRRGMCYGAGEGTSRDTGECAEYQLCEEVGFRFF